MPSKQPADHQQQQLPKTLSQPDTAQSSDSPSEDTDESSFDNCSGRESENDANTDSFEDAGKVATSEIEINGSISLVGDEELANS